MSVDLLSISLLSSTRSFRNSEGVNEAIEFVAVVDPDVDWLVVSVSSDSVRVRLFLWKKFAGEASALLFLLGLASPMLIYR